MSSLCCLLSCWLLTLAVLFFVPVIPAVVVAITLPVLQNASRSIRTFHKTGKMVFLTHEMTTVWNDVAAYFIRCIIAVLVKVTTISGLKQNNPHIPQQWDQHQVWYFPGSEFPASWHSIVCRPYAVIIPVICLQSCGLWANTGAILISVCSQLPAYMHLRTLW